ncbi:hypothetical protein N7454_005217 [Penicillium verhagenii]|nr:hypothetical protein N7454_005217 [Penicillium verhagenii]
MHVLAYSYCLRDSAGSQRANPEGILACIGRQLSRRSQTDSIAPPTPALYNKMSSTERSKPTPNVAEQHRLIREFIELLIAKKRLLAYICKKETKEELTKSIKEEVISKDLACK